MAMVNPDIKRRMDAMPDEETVIMKSQMQEVEERHNRNNDYKTQKKLKEKIKYAREGAIKKVTRPDGSEHYRREGRTADEKEDNKRKIRLDRTKNKNIDYSAEDEILEEYEDLDEFDSEVKDAE